eukprot:5181345-Heterocapsa_arctica.AAC.1
MLWAVFKQISIPAIARAASIFVAFFNTFDFKFNEFDGCMYGLVAKYGPDQGKPINTPWNIAFNKPSISDYLNRKCDPSHTHAPCSGQSTKGTEGYTPEIARAFHMRFKADVVKGLKACCVGVLHVMPVAPIARAPAACCVALAHNVLASGNEVIFVQGKPAASPALCCRGLPYEVILRMADSRITGWWIQGNLFPTEAMKLDLICEMNNSILKYGLLQPRFRQSVERCRCLAR